MELECETRYAIKFPGPFPSRWFINTPISRILVNLSLLLSSWCASFVGHGAMPYKAIDLINAILMRTHFVMRICEYAYAKLHLKRFTKRRDRD